MIARHGINYFYFAMALAAASVIGTPVKAQPAGNTPTSPVDGHEEPFQKARRVNLERMVRSQLSEGDFDEMTEIAPVVQLAVAQEEARAPLREQTSSLAETLKVAEGTEENVAKLLDRLKQELQVEFERRTVNARLLNEMTTYTTKPRLEAMLMVLGFVGDQARYTDDMSALNTATLWRANRDGRKMIVPHASSAEKFAERLKERAVLREHGLRLLLAEYGVTEKATQDVIAAYVNELDTNREPLRVLSANLLDTVTGSSTGDVLVPGLLTELKARVAEEKLRADKALAAFDASLGYSKQPRLEATLIVLGILGDEAVSIKRGFDPSELSRRRRTPWGPHGMEGWSQADIQALTNKLAAMTPEQHKQMSENSIRQADTNADGKFDRNEKARFNEVIMKRFDRNRNGQLDPDELLRMIDTF